MKILLDTNFLMAPFRNKADIYNQFRMNFPSAELMTLKSCLEELERKKEKGAIRLLEKNKVRTIDFKKGDADSSILGFAEKNDVVVATIDKELQKRLEEKGIEYIFLRQGKFIEKS